MSPAPTLCAWCGRAIGTRAARTGLYQTKSAEARGTLRAVFHVLCVDAILSICEHGAIDLDGDMGEAEAAQAQRAVAARDARRKLFTRPSSSRPKIAPAAPPPMTVPAPVAQRVPDPEPEEANETLDERVRKMRRRGWKASQIAAVLRMPHADVMAALGLAA